MPVLLSVSGLLSLGLSPPVPLPFSTGFGGLIFANVPEARQPCPEEWPHAVRLRFSFAPFSASSGRDTEVFKYPRQRIQQHFFAGVRTSCNAPPRTLPNISPALVHLSSVSLLDSIGDSSDLNQLNTRLIPLPVRQNRTKPFKGFAQRRVSLSIIPLNTRQKCPDGIPVFPDKNGSSGKRSQ